MWIDQYLLAEYRFPRLRSPVLAEGDEELLIAIEAALRGSSFPAREA